MTNPDHEAGLQLPAGAEQLGIDISDKLSGYLPLGFVGFSAHQLGNGDCFGFYWPVGQEGGEPLIAETQHDDGRLNPAFSGLAFFLRKTKGLAFDEWTEAPTEEEDPDAPLSRYTKARKLIARQAFEEAIFELENAVARLPEYTEALAALAGQYLRLGRTDDACRLAVQMIISPPAFGFGGAVDNITRWFSQLETCPPDLLDDPIWQGRACLAAGVASGGAKESPAYAVLREAMDAYAANGEWVRVLTLMQTYSDFMNAETVSFQERHGYDCAEHRARQRQLSLQLPQGPRYLV